MSAKKKLTIQIITFVVTISLIIWSFIVFSEENAERITSQNLSYVEDCTWQLANSIDELFLEGYNNVKIISSFYSKSLDKPEVDVEALRAIAEDSVFDYIEFVDQEGMNHNILGGISDATDRQYYLDGLQGNIGLEVIFDSRATHETVLMFYAPVYYKQDVIGVMIGVYQASNRMEKSIDVSYFDEKADVYLCMPNGNIVASNQAEDILDTTKKINMTDIIDNSQFKTNMMDALENGTSMNFTYGPSDAVGCITRLPRSGWYIVQIFPDSVNENMVLSANLTGMKLQVSLIAISLIVFLIYIYLYHLERKNIEQEAAKTENYKNAVVAGSIIAFEANLSQNMILEGAWANKRREPVAIKEILGITLPYDYSKYIELWAEKFVEGPSRDVFLKDCSSENLLRAFEEGKSEITFDYLTVTIDKQEIFARRSIYLTKDEKTGDIIAYCNVKDITEQKAREDYLIRELRIDELTGCYNRKAYEEAIHKLVDLEKEDNLVYVSIDVNGLKTINDTLGHAAGDELIIGSANCLKQCLGSYGRIYRTGGDEFIAIIYINESRLDDAKHDLAETVFEWKGVEVKELSISCGYVRAAQYPGKTIKEIAKIADEKMYEAKDNYYKATGLIRRKR